MIFYCPRCDETKDADYIIPVPCPEDSECFMCEDHEDE